MENKSSFKMLLFSKYSDPSKRLLGIIQENNLSEKLNINLVCIDNEIVRTKIQSSEIEINIVPCLLVVQNQNQVEKYEGKELNEWISFQQQNLIPQNNMMQHHPHPNMHPQNNMHPPPNMIPQNNMQQHPPPNMIPQNNMQQHPPPNMIPQNNMHPHPHHHPHSHPNNNMLQQHLHEEEESTTSIDKIIEEDNEMEELSPLAVQEITKKTKKKESKYKVPHDYNEYETKNKKKDQKKLDLLNAAMQMKKSREDEDKSINKNFPNM